MTEDVEHIAIREAAPGDEETIASLLYEAFIGYKYLYTEKAFSATILGVNKIKERIRERAMWVALFNGDILATLSLTPNGQGLYIRTVAVSPMFRRKGLAKILMSHAETEGLRRGFHHLQLTTTPFLFEALSLYNDLGFKEDGFEDLFGTRLIKMKKHLRPDVRDNKRHKLWN